MADALDGWPWKPNRVVTPPRFVEDDVQQAGAKDLVRLLSSLGHAGKPMTRAEISNVLNGVLEDPAFATRFRNLQLKHLQRLGQRFVWIEERRVPQSFPLKRYQTWRVNRLIIERLCPNSIREGTYLNTARVFKDLLENAPQPLDEIWVYAHPEHFLDCKHRLTHELGSSQVRIIDRMTGSWFGSLWCSETAQHWCRSFENWRLYLADMKAYHESEEP